MTGDLLLGGPRRASRDAAPAGPEIRSLSAPPRAGQDDDGAAIPREGPPRRARASVDRRVERRVEPAAAAGRRPVRVRLPGALESVHLADGVRVATGRALPDEEDERHRLHIDGLPVRVDRVRLVAQLAVALGE